MHKMIDEELLAAHKACIDNMAQLQAGKVCGCFYCMSIFPPEKIEEYLEEGEYGTALCPSCGIDAVIGEKSGYPITPEFLKRMYHYWFE